MFLKGHKNKIDRVTALPERVYIPQKRTMLQTGDICMFFVTFLLGRASQIPDL